MMDADKMRAEFEKWAKASNCCPGLYYTAWQVWQAAYAAGRKAERGATQLKKLGRNKAWNNGQTGGRVMNVDDAMEAAAEFRAAIEAHCAWPLFSETVAITLAKEVERLRAELDQYKKSLPVCEKHKPDSGCRSGCMICGLEKQSSALSRIDYACGEQNEMQMSLYGWDHDEERVVKAVQRLKAELAETKAENVGLDEGHDRLNAELTEAKAEVERLTREIERAYERAEVEQQLLQLGPPQAGRKWLRAKVDQLQAELAALKAASVLPVELVALGDADWQCSVGVKTGADADKLYNWLRERMKDTTPPTT